jgi:hypothetical protein
MYLQISLNHQEKFNFCRLYSLMLSDYRNDKWYQIFTQILLKTLQSAYLAASVTDFISCSIETLSPNIILNKTERLNILENLWKVLEVRFKLMG